MSLAYFLQDKNNNFLKKKYKIKFFVQSSSLFQANFVAISLLESLLIRVSRKESLEFQLLSLTKSKQSAYLKKIRVILSHPSSKLTICQITPQSKQKKDKK